MRKGFVFGKFMPLHKGHIALIDFALKNCDHLSIVLCYSSNEPIKGIVRKQWLESIVKNYDTVNILCFEYDENELPNTSVSSSEVSKVWATAFKKLLPDADIVFASEKYAEYIGEYMNVEYLLFDEKRILVPVSATQIRENALFYWNYLPKEVRPYFVKKICIAGTESTGKSTLTKNLAMHYHTTYVAEAGRDIVEVTDNCTYEDLLKIAEVHTKEILKKTPGANKLLFVDTDINITRSYSEFLFKRTLKTEDWMEAANHFDMYLFLEPDCEYVQDGTRLSIEERNKLSEHHKKILIREGINYISINGSWENRFIESCKRIDKTFGPLP